MEQAFFIRSLGYLLRETFEGSPPEGSAYLDRGIGVFSTLGAISAEKASRSHGATTIAAQTEHLKFYLDRLCEFIGGRTERVNWDDSWLIEDVNDDEWDALRASVRATYEKTIKFLVALPELSEDQVGMAMGMLAHTAYHLGAIRQLAKI